MPHLADLTLLVRDYDAALAFVGKLGFELVEDTAEPGKRWVTIRPPNPPPRTPPPSSSPPPPFPRCCASREPWAAPPAPPHLSSTRGSATRPAAGGAFFLATFDFARHHARFTAAHVEWVRPPADRPYGRVAVFADLYGNRWDLIQFAPGHPASSPPPAIPIR